MYKTNDPLTLTTIIDEGGRVFPLRDISNNTIYRNPEDEERKIFPTVDWSNKPDEVIPDVFDGRLEWNFYLPPLYFQQRSSWNTGLTRALASRYSLLSVGQIFPNCSYTYLSTCEKPDIILQNYPNRFEKSNYYGALFLYCYGTMFIRCFDLKEKDLNVACDLVQKQQCKDEDIFRLLRIRMAANIANNTKSIKYEIIKFGPVVATMKVPSDFASYNGLLPYKNTTNTNTIGARTIIIVGWTKIDDDEFWIVDPCIGYSWGIGGYFLLKFNLKHLGVEDSVLALYPDFDVFDKYYDKCFKQHKLPQKFENERNKLKVNNKYFTIDPTPVSVVSQILRRGEFVYKKYLPNYDKFFAKEISSRNSYLVTSSVKGIKQKTFVYITIIFAVILFFLYTQNKITFFTKRQISLSIF